jgi:hypothetical protein
MKTISQPFHDIFLSIVFAIKPRNCPYIYGKSAVAEQLLS